jgi:hypothetical protein
MKIKIYALPIKYKLVGEYGRFSVEIGPLSSGL